MYVAITRAEETLHLTHSRQRMLYGETKANNPSPFIMDISPELFGMPEFDRSHQELTGAVIPNEGDLPEFNKGERVTHQKFGEGRVVNITGGIITIAFADPRIGVKKLALSVAPIERIFNYD